LDFLAFLEDLEELLGREVVEDGSWQAHDVIVSALTHFIYSEIGEEL